MILPEPSDVVRPAVDILGLNYLPESTGNAPYTGALAAGLAARGHAVAAHTAQPHYPEWKIRPGYGQRTRRERIDGVEVVRRRHYVPRPPRGVRRLLSELSFGRRLLLGRLRLRRDAVVIAVSPALFSSWLGIARRGHRPLVVWVQDIYTLGLAETGQGGGLAARITRAVESRTLRAADRVVVIHQRFADYVTAELGVQAERVTVIRNWTHLPPSDPLDAVSARAALGWPAGITLAVHTGNMGVKQGLENIVDAARLADERGEPVLFLLVGGGGERAGLEARGSGVQRLRFIDPLGDDDYRRALAAADVLLVNEKPGVAAMAMPSKLTSYFDASRPVVAATDPDGIAASEVQAASAGIVVSAGSPAALLDAVLALRADPERAARLGAAGRRYRETVLDQSVAIERWAAVIAEVAGNMPETPSR